MNPSEVVDRALALLVARDMSAFAGLWARDGILEFPFAPAGYPAEVVGRDAIAEYLRDYPNILEVREIPVRLVHRTADPAVIIVEFEATGVAVGTGQPYRMRYIAVITVRDGEIQHYRDYWSPLAAAEIMGGAQDLVTAFGGAHE
ncbi:nuclear transport factor 2 family protein [Nocardia sp. NPDC052566]|uniref:nuclear transport factor 2 family protein n=1 Tax=Nocardia sp. NPDC052566 TaxID=3364330 RepID=UPI0037C97477